MAGSDRKRILFISQYFYPEAFNNNKVVEQLLKLGYDVEVMAAIPNYPQGKYYKGYGLFSMTSEEFRGAQIRRVPIVPRGNNALMLFLNYVSFVIFGSIKVLGYRKRGIDLVISSAPSPLTIALPGIFFSKLFGKKHFFWVQDVWPQTPIAVLGIKNSVAKRALKALSRFIYRNVDLVLVPSKSFIAEIREICSTAKFHYFPNTIEEYQKPLEPDVALRKNVLGDRRGFVVMYAGNIGQAQNVDAIVEAVDKIREKNIHFVFLGDGRYADTLKRKISGAGLDHKFHFVGRVPPEDVPRYLSFADAAVVTLAPDAVFDHVMPFRVQVFLACAKPIIAHCRGKVAGLVSDIDCGLVSKPNAVEELASNISALSQMSENHIQILGKNGRNYALSQFETDVVFNRFQHVIDEALQH